MADMPRETRFRYRATEVSRLEAFSDVVFGFALTLLVVSLEVPKTFHELMDDMKGFLGFAACFALLMWIWHAHYVFSRRYGLHDRFTIFANATLLFLVLFYVYPMKFLFNLATAGHGVSVDEARTLFTIYGFGLAAIFATYVILFHHAYALRDDLQLNAFEVHDTKESILSCGATGGIALLSVVLAQTLPPRFVAWSGWIYFLLGASSAWVGSAMGAKRRAMAGAMSGPVSATDATSKGPRPLQK
jgi:uncharacterized membrane protein